MSLSQPFQTTGRMVAVHVKAANRQILRALLSLVSAALLLRAGGMINQIIVSASFGAGAVMDAYFVAAAFPFLLIQLINSALEAAVIPVYNRLRLRESKEALSRLFSTLLNCLLLAALLSTLVLLVFRSQIVLFSAPGLDSLRRNTAVDLAPLLYLLLPLSLVIGLLESLLNAEGQFGWPAYAGLLVPLTTGIVICLCGKHWGIVALCSGSLAGTILQLAMVCLRARQARLRYRLVMDLHNSYLLRILHTTWPVLLGALISQGGPLVDQVFASLLPMGSIAALNYALKIVSLFSGILFVSVGRALLPALVRHVALEDPAYRAFKSTLRLYLWGTALCTLLLSLLLFLLAGPLVRLLFQRGAFSAVDVQRTTLILSGFVIGLMPMAAGFLLTRAFSALGETRVSLGIALVSIAANALFDALFAHFWQGLGIALATSAVYTATSLLLLMLLRRRVGKLDLWRVPRDVYHRVRVQQRKRYRSSLLWPDTSLYSGPSGQRLLFAALALPVLAGGAITVALNAPVSLRVIVGIGLFLCLIRYPYLLLLAFASVNVCIGSSLALFNGNNLDLLLIVSLLLVLMICPWRELCRRVPGLFWMVSYLAWVLAGIGLSPLDTRAFLTFWLGMLAAMGTGLLTIAFITTRRRLMGLVDMLLATALLLALYAFYGYLTHQHGEVDMQTLMFRVTSIFTQATTFALYLSLVLPLALFRCFSLRGAARSVYLTLTLCLLVALLLTFTRSAYVGLLLEALILLCCLSARKLRFRLIGGLVLLCSLVVLPGWIGQMPLLARFSNADVATFNGRMYLWQALLSRFQFTSWLGNGMQSSDQLLTYLRVGSYGQGVIGTAPHSLFLGTLYDHGVIGLCLLCGLFLAQGRRLLRGIRAGCGEQRWLFAVALAILGNLLLQSLLSRDLWIQAAGVPFWIIVSLPFARCWTYPALSTNGSLAATAKLSVPTIESFCVVEMSSTVPE